MKSFLLILLSTTLFGASFDCNKATTSIEKIVCLNKNSTLSKLDEELVKVYKIVNSSLSKKSQKKLLNKQRTWLRNRSKSCNIPNTLEKLKDKNILVSCLSKLYQKRVNVLKQKFGRYYLIFDLTKDKKIELELTKKGVFYTINHNRKRLPIEFNPFEINDDCKMKNRVIDISCYGPGPVNLFEFNDFNSDGYTDIAILTAIAVMQTNLKTYFFYSPKKEIYEKIKMLEDSYWLSKNEDNTLTGEATDNSRYYNQVVYGFDKNNNIYLKKEVQSRYCEKVVVYDDSKKIISVALDPSYIDSKDYNLSKLHLKKPTKIKVVDIDFGLEKENLQLEYKGKKFWVDYNESTIE